MNQIINKTKNLIFQKQKSIFSSALIISTMIILSSLVGFIRYRTLSHFFNKDKLDIFFAAFRIPDLIFEILITGAFSSAFIPIFYKYKNSKDELTKNISSIFNFISLILFLVIILVLIFISPIISFITPGYDLEKTQAIISFSRILLIFQLPFLIVGNFLTSLSQSEKKFLLPALAPIVYNLMIILITVTTASKFGLKGPIIGVCLGSIFFLIIQLPIIKQTSFTYQLIIKKTQGLLEFIRLVIPRILTVIVAQIDATIDLTLTTLLGSGAYTVFYLAQRLQLLPVSVFGMAVGQASLPYLSELIIEKKIKEFTRVIAQTILNIFFIIFPISFFLIFARTPIIRFFFGGEKFDWEATNLTAYTLSYFSLSIPFHSIYYFLTRCFYALTDSKTPFFVAFFSIILNLSLSIFFVIFLKLPVWSIALAFSISIIINVILLYLFLAKKVNLMPHREIFLDSLKIFIISFISAFISYFLLKLLDGLIFDTSRTLNLVLLIFSVGLTYFLLYLFLAWSFNIKEIYLISKLITKAKEYQKKITEVYISYE